MKNRSSRSGAVLLLVLGTLVLLSVIAVAFVLSSSDHFLLATGYSRTTEARLLGDSACQLAIGQIQTATGFKAGPNPPLWYSQPGMIRTVAAGGANTAYKLYSSAQMIDTTGFNPETLADVPQNWSTQPADYVDLNEPTKASIISPTLTYPIVDPNVNTTAGPPSQPTAVQGFWTTNSNSTAVADNVTNFVTAGHALPMPVRWLYVLQDGTIEALANGAAAGASATNPIVGRIAFWTDDETCKINLNTACGDEWAPQYYSKNSSVFPATDPVSPLPGSGQSLLPPGPPNTSNPVGPGTPIPGAFSSSAYTTSSSDYFNFYLTSAVTNEFQRYGGHPMSTYLSAVFPTLNRQQIIQLAPRAGQWASTSSSNAVNNNNNNGSSGGTVSTVNVFFNAGNNYRPDVTPIQKAIVPSTTRLYESVDELQYVPVNTSNGPNGNSNSRLDMSSVTSSALQPSLSPSEIQPLRFFLTTNSSAPELNVFGKPRVSIWPLWSDIGKWTAYDKLAAFCSTLGNNTKTPLFIARSNPGYGSGDDTAQATGFVNSNRDVFNYLYSMMSASVPGHTQSLAAKFGSGGADDSYQILTEIIDYIRCTNLQDPNGTKYSPSGDVAPLQISAGGSLYQGFGREPILNRLSFVFGIIKPSGSSTYSIQSYCLPQIFCPVVGQAPYTPDITIEIKGLDGIQLTGVHQGMPSGLPAQNSSFASDKTLHISPSGWNDGTYIQQSQGGTAVTVAISNYQAGGGYPFISSQIPLASINPNWDADVMDAMAGNATATLNDGIQIVCTTPITVTLTDLTTGYQQNFIINFPQSPREPLSTRLPSDVGSPYNTDIMTRITAYPYSSYFFCDENSSGNNKRGTSDSAVSIEISDPALALGPLPNSPAPLPALKLDADYRFISLIPSNPSGGTSLVPPDYWQPHYLASGPNVNFGYGPVTSGYSFDSSSFPQSSEPKIKLFNGNSLQLSLLDGSLIEFSASGSTVPIYYNIGNLSCTPDFPASLNSHDGSARLGALMSNGMKGDWDTGPGLIKDGAYINKADEGGTFFPFGQANASVREPTLFSPNRQIPSPIVFGSLPTGFKRGQPWQTLLFCPDPSSRTSASNNLTDPPDTSHPGFADPPDHLLLDLFDMPVVEPYAISQPFATAGKVNLNYQMVPFTYIHRDTALRAVLRSTMLAAIPTQGSTNYKQSDVYPENSRSKVQDLGIHYPIDLDTTLSIFEKRFSLNLPFQTASEICTMYLFPSGIGFSASSSTSVSDLQNWWVKGPYGRNFNSGSSYNMQSGDGAQFGKTTGYRLTGDNLREQPYNQIYSRLTTQSNTYTVHVWAQTLKQVPTSTIGTWDTKNDLVTGEYRGSYLVERYLDPALPSYDLTSAPALNDKYKMRVVASRVFAP